MKLKKAMKLYPIEITDRVITPTYALGNRHIFECRRGIWLECDTPDMKEYTESEAVAYLIEGAERKVMPIVRISLPGTDVDGTNVKFTNITANFNLSPAKAQVVLDTIWQAGYRPTKNAI